MGNTLDELLDLLEFYMESGTTTRILLHATSTDRDSVRLELYHPETIELVNAFLESAKPFVSDVDKITKIQSDLTFYLYYGDPR